MNREEERNVLSGGGLTVKSEVAGSTTPVLGKPLLGAASSASDLA